MEMQFRRATKLISVKKQVVDTISVLNLIHLQPDSTRVCVLNNLKEWNVFK